MTDSLRLRANAKLNLFLRVVGVDARGWHRLETIFHSVALADDVELELAAPGVLQVRMTAPEPARDHLPAPEDNLVGVAASRLSGLQSQPAGASITVAKNIPIGGGLGGGSADAAAAIAGLTALWGLDVSEDAMIELARNVGSDVPFCLRGGTASATGRGDDVTPLPAPPQMWFVVGISARPLMTADIYRSWDRMGTTGPEPPDAITRALAEGDLDEIARGFRNDLCEPALSVRPDIATGLEALRRAGAVGAGMSGSGPTVFGLARHEGHARALASKVEDAFARVEVAASAPTGIEWM